jgi:polyhydroxyalkanoate synthesis repressor PhaR
MTGSRTITKYPNRRLYDKQDRRYITLADIRKLVYEQVEFTVTDKKGQHDTTDHVLLQVIMQQENSDERRLSRDFLLHTIRQFGDPETLSSRGR